MQGEDIVKAAAWVTALCVGVWALLHIMGCATKPCVCEDRSQLQIKAAFEAGAKECRK